MSINAGIDVGSNSVRLLIARVENGKIEEILAEGRGITRLSAGIAQTGLLSEERMSVTLSLLKEFKALIDKHKTDKIFACGTSAVREAQNSDLFIAKVKEETGIVIKPISGFEEAQYTCLGAVSSIPAVRDLIIFDIGGGSVELSLMMGRSVFFSESVKTGVVKISDKFGFGGINTPEIRAKATAYIKDTLSKPISEILARIMNKRLKTVGTAGSVTTLAAVDQRLERYNPALVDGYTLTRESLERVLSLMDGLTPQEILKLPGIENGREDLAVPGALITLAIAQGLNIPAITVSDKGLREGLTLSA